jgi:hypothetical protein
MAGQDHLSATGQRRRQHGREVRGVPVAQPAAGATTGQTWQFLAAAIDNAHYFFSLSPADRRAYSEQMATNFADPITASWPNWAKVFFNNKGVAAKQTENCASYPPDDASVWDG